jgi:drug/metabolite transporter (DMT)-like permease
MTGRRLQLDATAIGLMVVLCACWGFNQVAIKVADAGISPILQAGLRSAGSAILVWAWSAHRGIRLFLRDGTLGHGILVGTLFAGEFFFLYWGLALTTASRAVLFLYTAPFVVALGAHRFVPGERLRWVQLLGLAGAFAGVAVAFGDALRFPTHRQLLGDGMVFIAGLLWGATTVVIRAGRLATVSPSRQLFYQLAVSTVLLPPLSWALGEPGIIAPTPVVIGMLAYQMIVVAFITYLAWFWLIARYPAGRLSSFTFLTPLFGVAAGALLLGEPITWTLVLAVILVGAGIYLVNRAQPVSGPLPAPTP